MSLYLVGREMNRIVQRDCQGGVSGLNRFSYKEDFAGSNPALGTKYRDPDSPKNL